MELNLNEFQKEKENTVSTMWENGVLYPKYKVFI